VVVIAVVLVNFWGEEGGEGERKGGRGGAWDFS